MKMDTWFCVIVGWWPFFSIFQNMNRDTSGTKTDTSRIHSVNMVTRKHWMNLEQGIRRNNKNTNIVNNYHGAPASDKKTRHKSVSPCWCHLIETSMLIFLYILMKFSEIIVLVPFSSQFFFLTSTKTSSVCVPDIRPIIVNFSLTVISCTRSSMGHVVINYMAKFLKILFSLPCLF